MWRTRGRQGGGRFGPPHRSQPGRVTLDATAAARVAGAVFADRCVRERLPSMAWGIVEHGELIASGGDVHAVYRIASMTKSFTAATVLSLRDEGSLRLDDPITLYAPE